MVNFFFLKCFAEVLQLAASRHNPSTSFFTSFLLSRATQFYTSISRVNLQSLKLQIVSYVYYPCQPLVHREGDYFLKATDTKSGIYSFPPVFSVDKDARRRKMARNVFLDRDEAFLNDWPPKWRVLTKEKKLRFDTGLRSIMKESLSFCRVIKVVEASGGGKDHFDYRSSSLETICVR